MPASRRGLKPAAPSRARRLLAGLVAISCAAGLAAAVQTARTSLPDPLDTPVQPSASRKPAMASGIARSGEQVVAVGPRGLILRSTDSGRNWAQVATPLASDLVAVNFSDANTVWAVGHDAVLLRSGDAGASWQRVLDGRSTLALLRDTYKAQAAAGAASAAEMVTEVDRSVASSATPDVLPAPFLDVWFADANEGYVVGAFGLLLRTRDGGKRWEPWMERTDNERRYHLYGVRGVGSERWIAGEQGLVMRLDAAGERFVKVETPYAGTFFGLHVDAGRVIAFGLRGNAYQSHDQGGSWQKVATHTEASIVAATEAGKAAVLLISQAGDVLSLAAESADAKPLQSPEGPEVTGAVALGGGKLALTRLSGVTALSLDPAAP